LTPAEGQSYTLWVPIIALFYGIRISMFWNEHDPAHFHAAYAEFNAIIDIQSGVVISGWLPKRQLRLVLAWTELHRDELMQDWELAREGKPLHSIEGLR
jgi:hypothetical protein